MTDWRARHTKYDDPATDLFRRLRAVQHEVSPWLDRPAP